MARIGLVLGAGGIVGRAFHVGVLAALAEVTGWDPREAEVVVGTSAGLVVRALLRAGVSAEDQITLAKEVRRSRAPPRGHSRRWRRRSAELRRAC